MWVYLSKGRWTRKNFWGVVSDETFFRLWPWGGVYLEHGSLVFHLGRTNHWFQIFLRSSEKTEPSRRSSVENVETREPYFAEKGPFIWVVKPVLKSGPWGAVKEGGVGSAEERLDANKRGEECIFRRATQLPLPPGGHTVLRNSS